MPLSLPQLLSANALDPEPDEVEARLRWARAQGHPFYPWPEVAPAQWREALGIVGRAVAEVLAGAERVSLPDGPDLRALGVAAFTSGAGPLLGHWIEAGRVEASEGAASLLRLHLDHGRRRMDRIRSGVAGPLAELERQGVRPTVVKGFHTAHAVFPEPGTRPISDVDLVVSAEQTGPAARALTSAGFGSRTVLRSPHMSEWTPPGEPALPRSLELAHADSAWSIDLHGSFERDFGGSHRVAAVPSAAPSEPWDFARVGCRVLAQPHLTAYLAAHASQELKNLTLVRLIELAWVMRDGVARGTLVWSELREALEGGGALRFVHPAVELTERLAPGTVDPSLREAVARAAPGRVRRVVAAVEPWSAPRLEGVSLEEQFMWADGPASYLGRLGRALWPAWAGPWPAVLRVQAARVRQLVARRVVVGPSGRRRP